MKEKLDKMINSKAGKALRAFYCSPWHIVVFAFICVICHSFDLAFTACILITLLTAPALVLCADMVVFVPFLTLVSFSLTESTMPNTGYFATPAKTAVLIVLLVVLVSAMAFNMVYHGNWKKIFKRAYLTISMCILTAALMLGGIGSSTFDPLGLVMGLAVGASMFIPYSMLVNCSEYRGEKTVEYFAWATVAAAMLVGVSALKEYILHWDMLETVHAKDLMRFGFAISNSAASFVLLALPMTFYLVYKYKNGYLFMSLVVIEILIIIFLFSRAVALIAIPGALIVTIVLMFKKPTGRLAYRITGGAMILAAVIVLAVNYQAVYSALFEAQPEGTTVDNGRVYIWELGLAQFKKYPVFGSGLWFLPLSDFEYYSFHCTPLTYLFCAGVVGLGTYIYDRYKMTRLVFSAKLTPERVFLALSVLVLIINGLLDVAMTSPSHLLFYAIMLALIESDVKAKRESAGLPPLLGKKSESTAPAVSPEAADDIENKTIIGDAQ